MKRMTFTAISIFPHVLSRFPKFEISVINSRNFTLPANYIHGHYDQNQEEKRLNTQNNRAKKFLWEYVKITSNDIVDHNKPFLEIGCGVGAQTLDLLKVLPENVDVLAIDIDPSQIEKAKKRHGDIKRVRYETMSATDLKLGAKGASGAYISWVLEHLSELQAVKVLKRLKDIVTPGGLIVVNEIHMQPSKGVTIMNEKGKPSEKAYEYLEAYIKTQIKDGGNPNFGEETNMINVIRKAGFSEKSISFRKLHMHYVQDDKKMETKETLALFESAKEKIYAQKMFDDRKWEKMVKELKQAKTFEWQAGQAIIRNL